MSMKAQPFIQLKNSNEQSFQPLKQINDKNLHEKPESKVSQSSDSQNVNNKKSLQQETALKKEQSQKSTGEELKVLQKLIISNQKSVQEQFQIIKLQYKEKQNKIDSLQEENAALKNKCLDLEENVRYYKQQLEKITKGLKQKSNDSSNLEKASQWSHVSQKSQQKDSPNQKTPVVLNPSQQQLTENLKECYGKINSFQAKTQLSHQQQTRIRQFLLKFMAFNPSFTMQLSTLVQSAVISLDSNLKELNREMQNVILGSHLGNYNKIVAKRQKVEEQKYNHWQTLSNLQVIRTNVEQSYNRKS